MANLSNLAECWPMLAKFGPKFGRLQSALVKICQTLAKFGIRRTPSRPLTSATGPTEEQETRRSVRIHTLTGCARANVRLTKLRAGHGRAPDLGILWANSIEDPQLANGVGSRWGREEPCKSRRGGFSQAGRPNLARTRPNSRLDFDESSPMSATCRFDASEAGTNSAEMCTNLTLFGHLVTFAQDSTNLGGPPRCWSGILFRIANGRGRQEECHKRGRRDVGGVLF